MTATGTHVFLIRTVAELMGCDDVHGERYDKLTRERIMGYPTYEDSHPVTQPADPRFLDLLEEAKKRSNNDKVLEDVEHQGHYTTGGVQPVDLIRDLGIAEDFFAGNVIKYVARYKKKDGLKDLLKARTYLNWLIDEVNK